MSVKVVPLTPEVHAVIAECAERLGTRKVAAEHIGVCKDVVSRILLRQQAGVLSTTVVAAQALLIDLRARGVNTPKRGDGQLNRKRWHCLQCDRDRPISCFNRRRNKRGEMTHRYTCKDCETRGRFKHNGATGYVEITERVWDVWDELARRCGSQAELARRLGMTSRAVNRILWRANSRLQKRNMVKALTLLHEMRQANEWLPRTRPARRSEYADGSRCRGCGTTLDNYTADCGTCWERRNGREQRAA